MQIELYALITNNMASIKCSKCGNPVSDHARECPKCTYPIKFQKAEAKNKEIKEYLKRGSQRIFENIGIIIIGFVIVIALLRFFVRLFTQ